MSELRGVVVSHAALAKALVEAVHAISGVEGVLTAVSNDGCDPAALRRQIEAARGTGPAVLFVDLPGGFFLPPPGRLAHRPPGPAPGARVDLPLLLGFRFYCGPSPGQSA